VEARQKVAPVMVMTQATATATAMATALQGRGAVAGAEPVVPAAVVK